MGLVFKPGNLVFGITDKEEELCEIHRLANKVYREAGYIKNDEDDLFPDIYEEHSTFFYAKDTKKNKIVGTIRAVRDVIGLPMDRVFDISRVKDEIKSAGGSYIEGSARVTDPMNSPKANFGVVGTFMRYLMDEGITYMLAAMNEPDMAFYEKLGFGVIGEKRYYEKVNSWSYPVCLKTSEIRQPYMDAFRQMRNNSI